MIKQYLTKIYRNIASLRSDLSILFLAAIIFIILMNFWFVNIPEIFKGAGKIGQISYELSFAYVSAFIFYFLVVHLKDQKDKENLYNYISNKTLSVIGIAKSLINAIAKEANVNLANDYPNRSELNEICKLINPNSKAPLLLMNMNYANWLQYFDYHG